MNTQESMDDQTQKETIRPIVPVKLSETVPTSWAVFNGEFFPAALRFCQQVVAVRFYNNERLGFTQSPFKSLMAAEK